MSRTKMDRSFPSNPHAISDEALAKVVAAALRRDFGKSASAAKRIGQLTNSNLRAIKNWYEARNAPSSGHLLLLARFSPSILNFILEQIGGGDFEDASRPLSCHNPTMHPVPLTVICPDDSTRKNVTLNVTLKSLNIRQRWFLALLKRTNMACAGDIAGHFEVAIRTARRDVEGLKGMSKIRFAGAKRTGRYRIMGEEA